MENEIHIHIHIHSDVNENQIKTKIEEALTKSSNIFFHTKETEPKPETEIESEHKSSQPILAGNGLNAKKPKKRVKKLDPNLSDAAKRYLKHPNPNLPKLRTENLNAAFEIVRFLENYPGQTTKELKLKINTLKKVLRAFRHHHSYVFLPTNYNNIFDFLIKGGYIHKVGKHFYSTHMVIV